ncbi:MAG: DUF433 domain-containing protein [Bacteroidetes bacterium]|nr:DUF433 domain-containing protein [Bacteroidota bacterium]
MKEKYLKRISSDPDILMGYPCIKGTRIAVYMILQNLASGESYEEILEGYPSLTMKDIIAALRYAANLTENEINAI